MKAKAKALSLKALALKPAWSLLYTSWTWALCKFKSKFTSGAVFFHLINVFPIGRTIGVPRAKVKKNEDESEGWNTHCQIPSHPHFHSGALLTLLYLLTYCEALNHKQCFTLNSNIVLSVQPLERECPRWQETPQIVSYLLHMRRTAATNFTKLEKYQVWL